jgi:hypothetical protein
MQSQGQTVDVGGVTRGFDPGTAVPHLELLTGFVEAIVARDEARIAPARAALRDALGDAGFADACAVVAAFHGFVRVADAIGIPHYTPPDGSDLSELRERVGVDRFYRFTGT